MAGKPAVETKPAVPGKPRRPTPGATSAAAHPVYSRDELQKILSERESWTAGELAETLARAPRRKKDVQTDSGVPIPDILDPGHRSQEDYRRDIGYPGRYPFTRGPQSTMYRGRLWTMRMFAGFGSPEDTNARFKYLLAHGMTGLSTAFDMPALMGYDADHPLSRGEVGKEGVAVSTARGLRDPLRRHPAGRRHHLDDHQRDARSSRSPCTWRSARSRGFPGRAWAAPSRTTC